MSQPSHVQPALDALEDVKTYVLGKIGKPGGKLNGRMKANFSVIAVALETAATIDKMNGTIEQQQQIMRKVYNDQAQRIAELRKALPASSGDDNDDGTSTTKGE
jgi:hypothetical protein